MDKFGSHNSLLVGAVHGQAFPPVKTSKIIIKNWFDALARRKIHKREFKRSGKQKEIHTMSILGDGSIYI